jgi:hypothetical protein
MEDVVNCLGEFVRDACFHSRHSGVAANSLCL